VWQEEWAFEGQVLTPKAPMLAYCKEHGALGSSVMAAHTLSPGSLSVKLVIMIPDMWIEKRRLGEGSDYPGHRDRRW
jgi:hypothetical protein